MNKCLILFFTVILFICTGISSVFAFQSGEIYSAFITGQNTIRLEFNKAIPDIDLKVELDHQPVQLSDIKNEEGNVYFITTKNPLDFTKNYTVKISGDEMKARPHWKAIDELYTYTGELGLIFNENQIEFKLWAPLASRVSLNLFEEGLSEDSYQTIPLRRGEKGVWSVSVGEDLTGKFYTYSVTNYGETKEVLDPYAKSMAVSTRNTFFKPRGAVVNP